MKIDEVMEHQEEQQEVAQVTPDEVLEGMDVNEATSEPEKLVPLSALQKERKKRQDAEQQNEWHMQQQQMMMQQQTPRAEEVDESIYENATKADVKQSKQEAIKATVREVSEQLWMEQNPEKKAMIDEHLSKFLKQRPNLALAIDKASNRYKEAYELMDALTVREKRQMEKPVKKSPAPNSPSSVPKSAVMSGAVDVMNMSDSDFLVWRKAQSKKR